MLLFASRRLFVFLISLLVASALVFTLLRLLPGDVAQAQLGTNVTEETLAALREKLGLNEPIWAQYTSWLFGILGGDFGTSLSSGASVGAEIAEKLSLTIPLVLCAVLVALVIALPLGVLAAVGHRHPAGALLSAFSQVGIAVPAFWLGILLISVFAVELRLVPAGGFPTVAWADPGEALRSLLLPAISLGVAQGAFLMRYVRSSVLEVMQEDFVRTARAKGLSRWQALRRHALRNAAIPIMTILGLQLAHLLIGTVVIENVFGLPGMGRMLLTAVANRDLLMVQGIVMMLTGAVLAINFLVDILYRVVDPRLGT